MQFKYLISVLASMVLLTASIAACAAAEEGHTRGLRIVGRCS